MSLHEYFQQFGSSSSSRQSPSSISECVDKILEEHPDSIREVVESSLPLHCALEEIDRGDDDDDDSLRVVIQRLVDAYPESVKMAIADDGRLPIHCACGETLQSIPVLRYLLDRYPESINAKDIEGFTPLHYVCYYSSCLASSEMETAQRRRQRLDVIDFLLERTPPTVRYDDFLLRIVPYQRPHQVEQIALRTADVPDTLRTPDRLLHALCHIPSSGIAFFWYLQQIHNARKKTQQQQQTKQQKQQQQQPETSGNHHFLDSLLDARDDQGNSILHTLVRAHGFSTVQAHTSRTCSEDVVDESLTLSILKWVCKLRPALCTSRNAAGDTPLHVACCQQQYCHSHSLAMLNLLLTMDPTVTDRRNKRGQLPIHLLVTAITTSSTPRTPFTSVHKKRTAAQTPEPTLLLAVEAIRALMRCSPLPLLAMPDPTTGLVPFLAVTAAAASNGDDDNNASLTDTAVIESVSTILREDPSPLMAMMKRTSSSSLLSTATAATTTTRKRKRQ
mmetsp:Transcript_120065/g.179380  ORF Transcript_120065/g.179380 Transcript_120065/m.179380 type:complete len:504 (+) Transcript_120065:85-1596(+)